MFFVSLAIFHLKIKFSFSPAIKAAPAIQVSPYILIGNPSEYTAFSS